MNIEFVLLSLNLFSSIISIILFILSITLLILTCLYKGTEPLALQIRGHTVHGHNLFSPNNNYCYIIDPRFGVFLYSLLHRDKV